MHTPPMLHITEGIKLLSYALSYIDAFQVQFIISVSHDDTYILEKHSCVPACKLKLSFNLHMYSDLDQWIMCIHLPRRQRKG